jgi:hypothetical protein
VQAAPAADPFLVLALRLCTINPRTTQADLDLVLAAILEAGRTLTKQWSCLRHNRWKLTPVSTNSFALSPD